MLFDRGIFARVEIPPQTIADGNLTLEVIEARVVNIRFHGDAGPAQAKVEGYIERLRGMKPFNLTKAERYLLLANEVPGVQVSAAVRPSGEAPGAVDLDITAVRVAPFDVAVAANNLGSQSLGPWSGLVRGDLNSMTPYGDRTSAVVYTTFDGKEQQVIQLLSEFRPTSTGLRVNGSVSYAHTQPGGPLTSLHLDGDALDVLIGANYPIIHSRSKDVSVGAGFEIADQHTVFASGGVLIDDKLRIAVLSADMATQRSLFGIPYRGSLELQFRQGLSAFGASKAGQPTLSRASGIPTASVGRLNGRLEILPFNKVDLDIEVMAQYTNSPLLSYEQISIGNLTIGRGYDPSTVTGDKGVAVRLEPSVGPFNLPLGQMVSAFAFYDRADTEFVDIGQKLNVSSVGAGFRLRPQRPDQRGFAVDVMYADPLDKISPAALSKPPGRVLVSVTYRY
jgi:hemolysin activation/secretion protein